MGVFAAYASTAGRALVDRELYLPRSWTDDRDRCRAAKIPDQREFATKNTLAGAIVRRVLASPLPIAWVTADAAYGQDNRFRRMLETSGVGYVLAVPKSQYSLAGPRIDDVFEQAPDQAWERRSCGAGAKGQREYDWAAVQLRPVAEYDYQDGVLTRRRWALARRSLSRPGEIAYYLGYAPLDVDVDELVRVAGARWAIEECFQAAKNECGLDEYEVRRYVGWYRHITLAMLAHAFLAAMTARAAEKGDPPVWMLRSSSSLWRKCGDSWQLTHPDNTAPAHTR
ncbi:IS701 family transposase [Streptomyces sp. NPDC127172]|uniref:IS701 family transposase n=1 Tax=Streptomyces sp. NPDC127172 TaxID=3345382 RepID=UPI003628852C